MIGEEKQGSCLKICGVVMWRERGRLGSKMTVE
jgi:hypothetical protein